MGGKGRWVSLEGWAHGEAQGKMDPLDNLERQGTQGNQESPPLRST